jgi:hypothetical protein
MVNSPCAAKKALGHLRWSSFASFDAVLQRRQHALAPHRGFHPRPILSADLCALCSPLRHYRHFAFALPRCLAHASTFLSPFPQYDFAFRTSRGFHRFGTMETLTPTRLTPHRAGLPAYLTTPSCRSVSNHAVRSDIALSTTSAYRTSSGFALASQARRYTTPNRVCYPTDRHFASGCSPPRLAATQLPSATELWHTPAWTFTMLMWRLHGRTMPVFTGMTAKGKSLFERTCGAPH